MGLCQGAGRASPGRAAQFRLAAEEQRLEGRNKAGGHREKLRLDYRFTLWWTEDPSLIHLISIIEHTKLFY